MMPSLRRRGGPEATALSRPRTWFLVAVVVSAVGGCHPPRYQKNAWLVTEGDAARYLSDAVDQPNPDHRRDAIQQLARTRFAEHDSAVDACLLIARRDPSEGVRCAAIALVARSRRDDAGAALVDIVGGAAASGTSACGRDGLAALNGLLPRVREGRLSPEQVDWLTKAAIRLMGPDESRDVRIASAMILGEIPRRESVTALIGSVRDADYGIAYQAERSLMRLTGVTQGHDPQAWQDWTRSNADWFAHRGALDGELESVGSKRWWPWRGASTPQQSFTGRGAP